MGEQLGTLRNDTEAFRGLWKSLRASAFAVKKDGKWIGLASRLQFSVLPPEEFRTTTLAEDFAVFRLGLPITEADEMLQLLLSSATVSFGNGIRVSFGETSAVNPSALAWSYPVQIDPGAAFKQLGIDKTCWVLTGTGGNLVTQVSYDRLRRLNSTVRLKTMYSDLRTLLRDQLQGMSFNVGGNVQVEVVAPVPITLNLGTMDTGNVRMIVEAPPGAFGESLFVLVLPDNPRSKVQWIPALEKSIEVDPEIARCEDIFEWPVFAKSASFHLYYKDEEISSFASARWWAGSRVFNAVDDFFDPLGDRLKQWLFPEPEDRQKAKGKPQRNFELGVVRLLALCGFQAAWYGEDVYGQTLDGAAVFEGDEPPSVILIECTIDHPVQKLSKAEEACTRLQAQLGRGVRVIPAVFTRVRLTQSDVRAAQERRVALLGRDEMSELRTRYRSVATALDYISRLAGKA